MKYLIAILMLVGCNTHMNTEKYHYKFMRYNADKHGAFYGFQPYAKKKNKYEPSKDVLSTGDTLYSDTYKGVMMKLLKSGDTIILIK